MPAKKSATLCLRILPALLLTLAALPGLVFTPGSGAAARPAVQTSPCPALSFNHAPAYPVGNTPTEIATGDFNRDGIPDLAVADNFELNVAVLFGGGKGEFGYLRKFDVQGRPDTLEVGDFNNDGSLDLAVGIYGNLVVLPGNDRGSFGLPIKTPISQEPRSTAVGDFDKDGNLDLVLINNYSDLFILLGNGRGGFSIKSKFVPDDPSDVAVADFNRDGIADLAVSRSFGDDVAILLGNGKGDFTLLASYKVGDYPSDLVVGDFNHDTLLDVATLNAASSDLSILIGSETKIFSAAVTYQLPFGYFGARAIVLGDFNEDGNADLAITGSTTLILYGDGKGAFPTQAGFAVGGSGLAVGDFDKDGHQDLALTTSNNTVALLFGNGAGKFAAPGNFRAGSRPVFVASGDFNADGKPDLAIANRDSDDLSILFGDGTGNFGKAVNLPVGDSPQAVAVADFNLDGEPDLAVAHYRASNNFFSVLLNNGGGAFGAPVDFPAENYSKFIGAADFNVDGKPDLVIGGSGSKAITILAGDGAGGFTVTSTLSVGSFESGDKIAIADFNLDGKLDLAASLTYDTLIFLGDGKGQFTQGTKLSHGRTFTVGDFNADGKADLAFYGFGQAEVYLGNGSGGFGSAIRTTVGTGGDVYGIRAVDFNEDGKLDLLVQNSSPGISVLLGDGQGKFTAETAVPVSPGPESVSLADFNLDGKLDIAAAGLSGGSINGTDDVQVFLRTCGPAADLAVTGAASPTPVITGTDASYTITIINNGTATATAVQITGFNRGTLNAKSCVASDGGQCEIVTEGFFIPFNYRASFDALAPGESRTVTLVYPVACSTFNNADFSLTARAVTSAVEANPANNSLTISPRISNPPPVIKCPTEVATVTAKPRDTSVVFRLPKPEATDNCPTVNVSCSEPFGNLYPLGTTRVTCSAVDGAQSSASCSVSVVVYDTCMQDDATGDSLLFNSYTGDYRFVRCGAGGFTIKGKGELSRDGCATRLTAPTISAVFENCILPIRHAGTATVRSSAGTTFTIRDSNTTNNTCACQ